MSIKGFQVIDHKISELPLAGKVYCTSIIETQGCRFAATVSVNMVQPEGFDPFIEAQKRAIEAALAMSQKSDFQLYGRASGGFSKGGPGKGKDPNATAAPGYVGSIFSKGLKEFGYKRPELQALIAQVTRKPYEKDAENALTNGQVATIIAMIEKGEKARDMGASAPQQSIQTSKQSQYVAKGPQNTAATAQNPHGASDAQMKLFTALFKKMGFKNEYDRTDYYAAYLQGKTKPETKEDFTHLIRWFKVDTVKIRLGRIGIHTNEDQAAWVSEYLGKSLKRIEDLESLTSSEIFNLLNALDSQIAAA